MSAAPLLYDTHMHTPLCKHAVGEPEEYAAEAERKGLKGIIITCHAPFPDYDPMHRMSSEQLDEYTALVERAARAWRGRVDVRLGIECDYFPGAEEYLRGFFKRTPFEYVLGSIHPGNSHYLMHYYTGDPAQYQLLYYEHLAMAAESGLFDCLSHPDLVKNFAPEAWDLDELLPQIEEFLDRIGRSGVAFEINTSGLQKALPEMNPGPRLLAELIKRGMRVVIGSDAHEPRRVGADFGPALEQLAELGVETCGYFLKRSFVQVKVREALASLAAPASVRLING